MPELHADLERMIIHPVLGLKKISDQKVNLILGPGAARGFMHVGAIRLLLEQGYQIESIIGSSAGAFIGLLYAKTHNINEVEELVTSDRFHDLFQRNGTRQTQSLSSLRAN